MSQHFFTSLDEDIQIAIREVAEEVGRFHRELGKKEDARYRIMLDDKLEITEIDFEAFAAKAGPLYEEFNEHYGPEFVETIQSYRSHE